MGHSLGYSLALRTLGYSLALQTPGYSLPIGRSPALLLGIHKCQPAVPIGRLATDDSEEFALQALGDRSAAAFADGDLVDRTDGRHFGGGADEEGFVREIQRLARHHRLADRESEVAGERDDRVARDAAENGRSEWRRVDDAVADHEDVLAAAFADVAVDVERD